MSEVQNNETQLSSKYVCEFCGKENIEKYQSGRFCNASCKNKWINEKYKGTKKKITCSICKKEKEAFWNQKDTFVCKECINKEREKEYMKNPKKCLKCGNDVPYKQRNGKYCSHKCANGRVHSETWKKNISKGIRKTLNEHPEILEEQSKRQKGKKQDPEKIKLRIEKRLKTLASRVVPTRTKCSMKEALVIKYDNKCEVCGYDGYIETRKTKTILELHHKDGDPKNNKLDNVQLLCINCHAKTPSYRRNRGNVAHKEAVVFKEKFIEDVKYCFENEIIDFGTKYWYKDFSKYRNLNEQKLFVLSKMKKYLLKFFVEECYDGRLLTKF
jgi:hypothetical protein